jgi:hypothetical protein
MRFRHIAILLLAGVALIGGGQFRIAKITLTEEGGKRTAFRVCLPGHKPDVFAMTDGDFMCRIFDWYGFRELDGGFGLSTVNANGNGRWPTHVTLATPLRTEADAAIVVTNLLNQQGVDLSGLDEPNCLFVPERRQWTFLYRVKDCKVPGGCDFAISINETGKLYVVGGM